MKRRDSVKVQSEPVITLHHSVNQEVNMAAGG